MVFVTLGTELDLANAAGALLTTIRQEWARESSIARH
jgi:hypothetical protein